MGIQLCVDLVVLRLMKTGYATDRPPSMMEMAKLSLDKDMRAAGQKVGLTVTVSWKSPGT